MKLEVGMYVRTISGIERLRKENKIGWFFEKGRILKPDVLEKYIIKASHNIIDLIEVGDYVNGYKVYHIDYAWNDSTRLVPYVDCIKNNYVNEIKSIVTKEQFESIKYSLEG